MPASIGRSNPAEEPQRIEAPTPPQPGRLVLFLLLCAYALLAYQFSFLCDDAFISFRYAQNWADGHGLRYNLGEQMPVEGYSNFLWVAYCTIIVLCKGDMLLWSQLESFLCGATLLYLVFENIRIHCNTKLPATVLAASLLGLSPAFVIWSTGGLETMSFSLLLFITFERLVLRRDGIAVRSGALAGLALALVRVEGLYWFLVIVILTAISRWLASQKFLRPLLTCLALCLSVYAIYFAWRYNYYQMPFANTAYAKVHVNSESLTRGACYVAVQFLTLLTPFIIFPGSIAALRKDRLPVGLPVALMAIAVPTYALVVSGDFMAMGRMLVPGLAFTAILFGWLIQSFWKHSNTQKATVATISSLVVAAGMLPMLDVHLVPESIRARFHFRHAEKPYRSELNQWNRQKQNALHWTRMGIALREYASPRDSLADIAIGAVGYYSNLFIYDRAGLVNKRVAMREQEGPLIASPGHDKVVPVEFFAHKKPTFLTAAYYENMPQQHAAEVLEVNARELRKLGLRRQYVVEFQRTDSPDANNHPSYLIVWRLIKNDESPTQAWRAFQNQLTALRMPDD